MSPTHLRRHRLHLRRRRHLDRAGKPVPELGLELEVTFDELLLSYRMISPQTLPSANEMESGSGNETKMPLTTCQDQSELEME